MLHEPFDVLLMIRNGGVGPAIVDLGMDRKGGITIKTTLPDGTIRAGRIVPHGDVSRRGRITLGPGQSYSQRLILDEWVEFPLEGRYHVAVSLDNPVLLQDGTPTKLDTINITANVGAQNDDVLKHFCADTLQTLLFTDSYNTAVDAAQALSHVRDPIAISYLQLAIESPHHIYSIIANGLERIGTDDAIEALLRILEKEPKDESAYTKLMLSRLAARTSDPSLQLRIREILQEK